MTTTVAMLYPGHAAEDDYPLIESAINGGPERGTNTVGGRPAVRLPIITTDVDSDDHTVEAMLAVGESDRLIGGAQLAAAWEPSALMWACTSGSFLYGWEGAHEQADRLSAGTGLPVSSTSLAFAAACQMLGVTHVAVAATYPAPVATGFVGFLAGAGINVANLRSHDIETASEAGTLDGDRLFGMLAESDSPQAQAILVPDTALHTAMWIDGLEERFDKPVLTANQVTAWQGLRLAGITPFAAQLGMLFGAGATLSP